MPAQYSNSSGFQGANPVTSLSARPPQQQQQQQPQQGGRISPRDSLARSQQQGGTGYSQRSHAPETPASQRGAGHARGGSGSSASGSGSAQISSRAFR
jgi:hypothetical protein